MKLFWSLILIISSFGVVGLFAQATPKLLPQQTRSKLTSNKKIVAAPAVSSPPDKSASEFRVEQLDVAKLSALLTEAKENKRPLLVNFWATWCVPCREEFPDLVKIDNKFRSRGLNFFTVSADEAAEIATTVPQFLREVKATNIPAYLIDSTETEAAINLLDKDWSGALPTTFLFDKAGNLVFKHSGRIKRAELEAAIKRVMSDR